MKLSDLQCRTAKTQIKKYKLADGGGLYLEVIINGKEKRIALGIYPEISLLMARKLRAGHKEEVRNGADPALLSLEQKQTAELLAERTFEEIAKEWHQQNVGIWKQRYAQTILHRLEKYVFPYFGNFPISQIKSPVVLNCLQQIEKTAPDMARRVKQYIRNTFKYARVTGRVQSDPTYGIEVALKKYKKGHFTALSVD